MLPYNGVTFSWRKENRNFDKSSIVSRSLLRNSVTGVMHITTDSSLIIIFGVSHPNYRYLNKNSSIKKLKTLKSYFMEIGDF